MDGALFVLAFAFRGKMKIFKLFVALTTALATSNCVHGILDDYIIGAVHQT